MPRARGPMLATLGDIKSAIRYLDEGNGVASHDIWDRLVDEQIGVDHRLRAVVEAALEYGVHRKILMVTNQGCTIENVRYAIKKKKRIIKREKTIKRKIRKRPNTEKGYDADDEEDDLIDFVPEPKKKQQRLH